MTITTDSLPGSHPTTTVAGSAHLAELLRALPGLAQAHVAAAAKFEACVQMIAMHRPTIAALSTLRVETEVPFAESNPVLLAEEAAQANVRQRLARDIDGAWADLYECSNAAWPPQAPPKPKRKMPTREERRQREKEKHEIALAECRARSAERHSEQRSRAIKAAMKRATILASRDTHAATPYNAPTASLTAGEG